MSLEEVAEAMNQSGRYERAFTASDVSRIERHALQKVARAMRDCVN